MPRSQSLQEFLGLEAGDFKVLLIAASVLVALLVLGRHHSQAAGDVFGAQMLLRLDASTIFATASRR